MISVETSSLCAWIKRSLEQRHSQTVQWPTYTTLHSTLEGWGERKDLTLRKSPLRERVQAKNASVMHQRSRESREERFQRRSFVKERQLRAPPKTSAQKTRRDPLLYFWGFHKTPSYVSAEINSDTTVAWAEPRSFPVGNEAGNTTHRVRSKDSRSTTNSGDSLQRFK